MNSLAASTEKAGAAVAMKRELRTENSCEASRAGMSFMSLLRGDSREAEDVARLEFVQAEDRALLRYLL